MRQVGVDTRIRHETVGGPMAEGEAIQRIASVVAAEHAAGVAMGEEGGSIEAGHLLVAATSAYLARRNRKSQSS